VLSIIKIAAKGEGFSDSLSSSFIDFSHRRFVLAWT